VLENLNPAATSSKTTPCKQQRVRFGRPNIPRRLPGLDLRSAEGKHYSLIYAEVAAEFGAGAGNVSLARDCRVRYALEQIQTEVVRGSPKAREDINR
jgi:hypothetical protein